MRVRWLFISVALGLLQDGSGDGDGDGSGSGTAGKAGSDEAEEAPVDNLSDVPSSDEEEEEEIANHCISQYTKVDSADPRLLH